MEDLKASMMAYAAALAEELNTRAESIREETRQFEDFREGRYSGRFDSVADKLDGAALKVQGIIARLEADAVREEARSHLKDDIRRQVRSSMGYEEPENEATDEEKLRILQMLEQGTISIEQAEELISAL